MTDIATPPPAAPASRPHKQEQEPASDQVTEVAPGVIRMQLPIWMPGLGHVNMYGLLDERGLAVVDPGLPGPQSWKAVKRRLRSAGYRVNDVHTVIVTHSHPDHFGCAGRLAREAGAELVAHAAFTTWSLQRNLHRRPTSENEAVEAERAAARAAQLLDVGPDSELFDDPLRDDPSTERTAQAAPWVARRRGAAAGIRCRPGTGGSSSGRSACSSRPPSRRGGSATTTGWCSGDASGR